MESQFLPSEVMRNAARGSLDPLRSFLKVTENLTRVSRNKGESILHLAAGNGHMTLVQHLCSLPFIDLEFRDYRQRTALHAAIIGSHYSVVQYLLRAGASPHARSISGEYAAHLLALTGPPLRDGRLYLSLLDILVGQLSWVDHPDNQGNTCLHLAAPSNPLAVSFLLQLGADLYMLNKEKRSPFDTACLTESMLSLRVMFAQTPSYLRIALQAQCRMLAPHLTTSLGIEEESSKKLNSLPDFGQLSIKVPPLAKSITTPSINTNDGENQSPIVFRQLVPSLSEEEKKKSQASSPPKLHSSASTPMHTDPIDLDLKLARIEKLTKTHMKSQRKRSIELATSPRGTETQRGRSRTSRTGSHIERSRSPAREMEEPASTRQQLAQTPSERPKKSQPRSRKSPSILNSSKDCIE